MHSVNPQNAPATSEAPDHKVCWGLLRWRPCPVPTVRGFVVFVAVIIFVLVLGVRQLHPFLAIDEPIHDGLLVVEGWTPDYGMQIAADELKRDHYQKIYVTGGPIENGSYLVGYKTYAQLGAATLMRIGLESNVVQAVPAPRVLQDRTYTSAVALKQWLLSQGITPERIHLISDGPHTRRSRLLYEKAMGPGVIIGVSSIHSKDYDEQHWWRSSAGVRTVIGEGLAYLYARFIFSPPKQAS